MSIVFAFLGGLVVGFLGGVLVYRNNRIRIEGAYAHAVNEAFKLQAEYNKLKVELEKLRGK